MSAAHLSGHFLNFLSLNCPDPQNCAAKRWPMARSGQEKEKKENAQGLVHTIIMGRQKHKRREI